MQQTNIFALRRKILSWYRANKRDLPWRKTRDPYAILVSEVMLQQTQVDRVIPKYKEFLKRFPTIRDLAEASLGDVLKLWSGLGYNRRAKYLKEMAEMVRNGYKDQIPDTYDELRKLPGVGDYTANAVLCFAFKKKAPAVDTNVRNVMERELNGNKSLPFSSVNALVLKLMDGARPDEFLHALMDYSAMTLARPTRKKGHSVPFKQSNRYLRGRIMKRLTDRPYRPKTLIVVVQEETRRSQEDIARALDGLLKENLITRSRGLLQLPSEVAESPHRSPHALATSGSTAR